MEEIPNIRQALEREIDNAFRGVTLGRGMSLRQAQVFDERKTSLWKGSDEQAIADYLLWVETVRPGLTELPWSGYSTLRRA